MRAVVEPFRGDWYTQAKKETETTIVRPLREERRLGLEPRLRRDRGDRAGRRLRAQDDPLAGADRARRRSTCPPSSFATEAIWFVPEPEQLASSTRCRSCSATLHAAEHALIAMLPLWAMCDRWDIGGLSTNLHPQTGRADGLRLRRPRGGVGIAERGFEQFEGWVADTARDDRRLPVPRRLPVVRPEPEVRQPERDARQGRRTARCSPGLSSTA